MTASLLRCYHFRLSLYQSYRKWLLNSFTHYVVRAKRSDTPARR